jgi:hypothetical protein
VFWRLLLELNVEISLDLRLHDFINDGCIGFLFLLYVSSFVFLINVEGGPSESNTLLLYDPSTQIPIIYKMNLECWFSIFVWSTFCCSFLHILYLVFEKLLWYLVSFHTLHLLLGERKMVGQNKSFPYIQRSQENKNSSEQSTESEAGLGFVC